MIGSSFLSIADYLKMYSVYCNNQQNSSDMKKVGTRRNFLDDDELTNIAELE